MLLTNHTLTGATLALVIRDPVIIVPVAFASHLALDSLPHFGIEGMDLAKMPGFAIGIADCFGALTAYLLLIHFFPSDWLILTLGIFFACLPDLQYIPRVLFKKVYFAKFTKFHGRIQWGEFPAGLVIEALWASCLIGFLVVTH